MQQLRDKSPIIVYNDDTRLCAEFLLGLISELSNSGRPINSVAIDAEIFASYTAEHRNAKQRIIYIGDFKESKVVAKNILNWQFEKYGIRYGWHGNRGVIAFDEKPLSESDFHALVEFGESELNERELNMRDKVEKRGFNPMQALKEGKWKHKSKAKYVLELLSPTIYSAGSLVKETIENRTKLDLAQMREQQQRFAVLYFCLIHLDDFMGFKEDGDAGGAI
jgi:hypothetical protein